MHFSFTDVSLLHKGHQHVSGHLQGGENKNKKYNYNSQLNTLPSGHAEMRDYCPMRC